MISMGFKCITTLLFLFLSLSSFCSHGVEATRRSISIEEDEALERQLKILNKPPVKSMKVDNYILDCVDINKQPAFEHPSLRNHKIQMKPTFLLEEEKDEATRSKLWFPTESCPSGTVPIRRTRKEDLMNAKSIPKPYPKKIHPLDNEVSGQHQAILETVLPYGKYYGAKAYISVNNLTNVAKNQYSMSQIWVQSGSGDQFNSLQVGWAVHPQLYGDTVTRLTTFMTTDGDVSTQKTECFNLLCFGFIQVHPQMHLGMELKPVSVYGGQQYIVNYMIRQDKSSGHWWFIAANNIQVGYWPKGIFNSQMQDGADNLKYGGLVMGTPNGASPPMGNGQFASNKYKKTAYFARLQYVGDSREPIDLLDTYTITFADATQCYTINYYGYQSSYMGHTFSFGGPGGSNCGK